MAASWRSSAGPCARRTHPPRRAGRTLAGAAHRMNGSPALSDRLVEDLTAHRTAALRTVLAGNADVALAAVVHALALPIFFPHETESCLGIDLDSTELRGSAEAVEDSPAGR